MQRVGSKTMYDSGAKFHHMQRFADELFRPQSRPAACYPRHTDVDALNDLFAAAFVTMINDFFLLVVMAGCSSKRHPPRARHPCRPPRHLIVTMNFPQVRSRRQSPHSNRHRPHQRLSPGTFPA